MSEQGKPENPQAFPDALGGDGMSLRDYFAAKAMQGYCANPEADKNNYRELAMYCYSAADAMLKERGVAS
jgi:hypothetical protein